MGVVIEDLADHEGYADWRLPDGRLAGGVWSHQTSGFTAYVAACGCGWTSQYGYPPTQQGERAALEDWREEHAAPLMARQAQRRRAELAQVLRALGGIADFVDNPANLARIGRAGRQADRSRPARSGAPGDPAGGRR